MSYVNRTPAVVLEQRISGCISAAFLKYSIRLGPETAGEFHNGDERQSPWTYGRLPALRNQIDKLNNSSQSN